MAYFRIAVTPCRCRMPCPRWEASSFPTALRERPRRVTALRPSARRRCPRDRPGLRARLHVTHARKLQGEVDAVAFALGLELGDLAAQLLCRLGAFGGLGQARLKLRDAPVTLGDCLLELRARYLRAFLRLLPFLAARLRCGSSWSSMPCVSPAMSVCLSCLVGRPNGVRP